MIKKALGRLGLSAPALSNEQKIASFLSSPVVADILQKQDADLLSNRQRHAGELAKLREITIGQLPDLDARVAKDQAAFLKAQSELSEAQTNLRRSYAEKASFLAQSTARQAAYEGELRASAPFLDQAILALTDLLYKNQNIKVSESGAEKKFNTFGVEQDQKITTNALAARTWYSDVGEAIRELDAMKLDPDHTRFPARIEEIMAKIHDPDNLPTNIITIEADSGKQTVRRGR